MVQVQFACFLSPIEKVDGLQASIGNDMIDGMTSSGSPRSGYHGVTIEVTKDFVSSEDEADTLSGLTLAYLTGEQTDLTTLGGMANYYCVWRVNIPDENGDSTPTQRMPHATMTSVQWTALYTFIANKLGRGVARTQNWMVNHIQTVNNKSQLRNEWATVIPRKQVVNRLMKMLSHNGNAIAELNNESNA